MSNATDLLSENDVRQLVLLLASLDRSSFDFLQLQIGELQVTLSKGDPPPSALAPVASVVPGGATGPRAGATMSVGGMETTSRPATAVPSTAVTASATRANGVAGSPASDDGVVTITSPILGVFYAQPQPGAEPFVRVGSEVQEDTTVALLEVMKTFNAVPAGVRGTIVEICATNAHMVEFGQALFRVRPPGEE